MVSQKISEHIPMIIASPVHLSLRIYNPERHETGVNLHLPSGFRARAVRLDETPLDSGEEFLESSPVILPAASILTLQRKRPASSMVMVDRGEIFSKGDMATK